MYGSNFYESDVMMKNFVIMIHVSTVRTVVGERRKAEEAREGTAGAEMKREVPTICVNFMVVVLISYTWLGN